MQRLRNWFSPKEHKQEKVICKNTEEDFLPILPVTPVQQDLMHHGDPLLTRTGSSTSTEKATYPGILDSFSQTHIDHGAPSTILEPLLGFKFETQENSKTTLKPISLQKHTVNEYLQSSGSKVNAHKGTGVDNNNITTENTKNPLNFSEGMPERHANKFHNTRVTHIAPQQIATKVQLTSVEQQASSESIDNPRVAPNDPSNKEGHVIDVISETQKHRNDERQDQAISKPYNPIASGHIDKKAETEFTILSSSEKDVHLEPNEQVNNKKNEIIPIQTVTPKVGLEKHINIPQQPAANYEFTSGELQLVSEIFENAPLVPNYDNSNNAGYSKTLVKMEPQKHNDTEGHHKLIEPYYAASLFANKKGANGEADDRLIVSPSEKDDPLEIKEYKTPTKGFNEYDYAANTGIINIEINSKAIVCNTSAQFDLPNVDTNASVLTSENRVSSSHRND